MLSNLLFFTACVNIRETAKSGYFGHLLEVVHVIFFAVVVIILLVDGFQLELFLFRPNKEVLEVGQLEVKAASILVLVALMSRCLVAWF